jgi:hypothetical protein
VTTDPLQRLLSRTSEATAARPETDPVIDVRVNLATGEESYDLAQVERALQHEKPERVTVLYILSYPGDEQADPPPVHDYAAAARDTKSRLDL